MRKVLQINSVLATGSTGKIAEDIGKLAIENGWESYIAYGRRANKSASAAYRICGPMEIASNVLYSRIFDKESPLSILSTKRLINYIKGISPDIIHLHNLHGYYLNIPLLLDFLSDYRRPIIWTLHDCNAFTGHCAYFRSCDKWMHSCGKCMLKNVYPASYVFDNSRENFGVKKSFAERAEPYLNIVPVSEWMGEFVSRSIFKNCSRRVIRNGIDLEIFKPQESAESTMEKYSIPSGDFAIAVANTWSPDKGYQDLFKICRILEGSLNLVVVGVEERQCDELKKAGMVPVMKTDNQLDLAKLYSAAKVFLNPTYLDNYPTVNLEAIACGTPVITYATGGSPESVDESVGFIVKTGDIKSMSQLACKIAGAKADYAPRCRQKAERDFDKRIQFGKYIALYENLCESAAAR